MDFNNKLAYHIKRSEILLFNWINNPANVIDLAIPLNKNIVKACAKKFKNCSYSKEAE